MSLGFQKRSELKDLERIIPEVKPSGASEPWLSEAKRTERLRANYPRGEAERGN
jgi:hypothetical protein